MAGIGFELKKLFSRRGLFASFRAYGYAGIICTGPMLLGIVLLLGVMFLCDHIYTSCIIDGNQFLVNGSNKIYCRYAL